MSNEEFERKMTFIVEQQAQFASDIQRLQESQSRTEQIVAQSGESVAQAAEIVAQTAESVAQTAEVVTRLANVTHVGFNDVNAKINALVDSQIRTDEKVRNLMDSQIRTDESVRNLAAVVDRYIDKGRNGKSA